MAKSKWGLPLEFLNYREEEDKVGDTLLLKGNLKQGKFELYPIHQDGADTENIDAGYYDIKYVQLSVSGIPNITLVWLVDLKCFAQIDTSHHMLFSFYETSWADIVQNPDRYMQTDRDVDGSDYDFFEKEMDKLPFVSKGLYYDNTAKDAESWKLYNEARSLQWKENELEKTVSLLEESMKLSPKNYSACYLLGKMYKKQKAWQKVIDTFDIYTKLKVKNNPVYSNKIDNAYFFIGFAYSELGNVKEAIIQTLKAYKIDPKDKMTLNNLAYWYGAEGDRKSAIKYWKKLLRLINAGRQKNTINISIAGHYLELKDRENAKKYCLAAKSIEDLWDATRQSEMLLCLEDYEKAIISSKKALELDIDKDGKAICLFVYIVASMVKGEETKSANEKLDALLKEEIQNWSWELGDIDLWLSNNELEKNIQKYAETLWGKIKEKAAKS